LRVKILENTIQFIAEGKRGTLFKKSGGAGNSHIRKYL
jgi:hypothetical protein